MASKVSRVARGLVLAAASVVVSLECVVGGFAIPGGRSGAVGTIWLAADQKWNGYVWPLPTSLAASASLAYVQPTQSVGNTESPGPVAYFASYAAFAQAIEKQTIPAGIRYAAYDPERWSYTPLDEQREPINYMHAFTSLAHDHGLGSILVPGRDLMLVTGAACTKETGETLNQAFVRCDIAEGGNGANLFVTQAAPVQTTPAQYEWLVGSVSSQVRGESPSTTVLATVRPTSARSAALASLLKATEQDVSGFEVNCTPSTATTAVALIDNA
jgi:hypothetical protein